MKKKLSISIEEETITKLEEYVNESTFRNKGHLIKFVIDKFLENRKNVGNRKDVLQS